MTAGPREAMDGGDGRRPALRGVLRLTEYGKAALACSARASFRLVMDELI